MDITSFVFVCIVSVLTGIVMSLVTRGITTDGKGSDANKQMRAVANIDKWRWFSDMHVYSGEKARLKDIGVLGIVLFKRILKKNDFHTIVVMCAAANSVAAILLYLVATFYWGRKVGLLLFGLYITSFWSYQVVLQGGYQVLATMFFLLTVYYLYFAGFYSVAWIYYWIAGMSFALMIFSSASSRKYIWLVFAALVYNLKDYLFQLTISDIPAHSSFANYYRTLAIVILISIPIFAALNNYLGKLTALSYQGRPAEWLKRKNSIFKKMVVLCLAAAAYLALAPILSLSIEFYLAQFLFLSGSALIFIALMLPNLVDNLKGFYSYWTISQWGGHFMIYVDHFAKKGIKVKKGQKGGGPIWYPRFYFRMIPFPFVYFLFSLASICVLYSYGRDNGVMRHVLALIVGVLPIIYTEITGGAKFGRTYFPTFIGLLFFIGYSVSYMENMVPHVYANYFWISSVILMLICFIFNAYVFFSDVLPARMSNVYFLRKLKKMGIEGFHTYNIQYNNSFVFAIDENEIKKFEINYIKSIKEAKDGYVVIPGTSSKASCMESESYAVNHGDFDEDPILNELLRTRKIKEFAVASFKTVGSSGIWGQEGEVPSYRDLILHEIKEEDRFRSLAWILDATKLRKEAFS